MNNIFLNIASINQAIANVKEDFSKAIVDKSFTLNARWSLFLAANDALKNTQPYFVDFKSLPKDFIMYDGEVHMERHQVLDVSDLVERIEEMMDNLEDYEGDERDRIASVDIEALKEEILAMNIGSFEYDW